MRGDILLPQIVCNLMRQEGINNDDYHQYPKMHTKTMKYALKIHEIMQKIKSCKLRHHYWRQFAYLSGIQSCLFSYIS